MQRRTFLGGSVAILAGLLASPDAGAEQPPKLPVIGYLSVGSPGPFAPFVAAFRQGLGETGYIEGGNVVIEYRWAEDRYDRLPALATGLVERKVAVIVAAGGIPPALAAKKATATIPIVFGVGVDPVSVGLIASLAHPGGNLTGVSYLNTELTAKRFELLSELVPQARMIALLVNPNNPGTEGVMSEMQEAARVKGTQLYILKATAESGIDDAFASYAQQRAGALVVQNDPLFALHAERLLALASRFAVPAIEAWREFADAGGLISYGPSLAAASRKVGNYAGRILAGAKPDDLPVEQPTRFELVVNLKTANALGLTVPPSMLDLADEVIE
jgi:putative ABC transport system substrate-binding protein